MKRKVQKISLPSIKIHNMKSFFPVLALIALSFASCGTAPKVSSRQDTVIVAYNQGGQYLFNKAIVWTHMARKFKNDSGLEAEQGIITQFALRLPTSKTDSIRDSTTHSWRVKDSYPIVFLADSLSKYIHIIDTLH
jgi:hypothetical protein